MIDPHDLDLAPRLGSRAYRIGVIGAGRIVRECHLPAYRSMGWQVVRIASRTLDTARAVASEFDIGEVSDDFLDVVRDERVEVVDISLPPHLHREVAEAAFAAGKHVMLQKPMATTLEDARGHRGGSPAGGREVGGQPERPLGPGHPCLPGAARSRHLRVSW